MGGKRVVFSSRAWSADGFLPVSVVLPCLFVVSCGEGSSCVNGVKVAQVSGAFAFWVVNPPLQDLSLCVGACPFVRGLVVVLVVRENVEFINATMGSTHQSRLGLDLLRPSSAILSAISLACRSLS